MKHNVTIIIAAALAASLLLSCSKDSDCRDCFPESENQEEESTTKGTLTLSLDFPEEQGTKALTAYTAAQPYETAINKVQVLVFNASGRLNAYRNLGTTAKASITTTTGQKKVWAIINGPDLSGIFLESALRDKGIALSSNSTTPTIGFVMAGSTSCNLTAGGATANIAVSRLTSRVALQSVKNSLSSAYTSLTVKKIYLINVVGNQNLAGTLGAAPSLNQKLDKGEVPSLLSKTVNKAVARTASYTPTTPDLFYGYANATATKTRLVVETDIAGQTYYYPITLPSLERNKTYTISLDIQNLGSDDPDKPVEKGAVSVNVSVAGWVAGPTYEETI